MSRLRIYATLVGLAGALSTPLGAQTIYYEDHGRLYPFPAAQLPGPPIEIVLPEDFDDGRTAAPAHRVLPPRTTGEVPALAISLPEASPATAALPVLTSAGRHPDLFAPQSGHLPDGALLVQFDRAAWLAECNSRLSSYEESERARAIGALGGAAIPADTPDPCAVYLDDYLARAATAPLTTTFVAGRQYMLVPVTVPVAQQVIYRSDPAPQD